MQSSSRVEKSVEHCIVSCVEHCIPRHLSSAGFSVAARMASAALGDAEARATESRTQLSPTRDSAAWEGVGEMGSWRNNLECEYARGQGP